MKKYSDGRPCMKAEVRQKTKAEFTNASVKCMWETNNKLYVCVELFEARMEGIDWYEQQLRKER